MVRQYLDRATSPVTLPGKNSTVELPAPTDLIKPRLGPIGDALTDEDRNKVTLLAAQRWQTLARQRELAGRSPAGLISWLDDPVDWVPPPLTIEVAVSMNDPVIRRLNQAEEQGDRKEQPKAVQPLPDLWLYPSSQAAQMMHR